MFLVSRFYSQRLEFYSLRRYTGALAYDCFALFALVCLVLLHFDFVYLMCLFVCLDGFLIKFSTLFLKSSMLISLLKTSFSSLLLIITSLYFIAKSKSSCFWTSFKDMIFEYRLFLPKMKCSYPAFCKLKQRH